MMNDGLSAAVYSTVNATQFARLLSNDDAEPAVEVRHEHSLLPGSAFLSRALPDPDADASIVVTTAETVLSSVGQLQSGRALDTAALDAEVDAFSAGMQALAVRSRMVFVPTWLTVYRHSGGVLALDERWGLDAALARANRRLVAALRNVRGVVLLNAEGWQRLLGSRAFSSKGWYLTRDPYTQELWKLVVADVKTAVAASYGMSKKLLILDLDNTLWGGEVGDDGVAGLRLGGHDAAGEAYRDFQREVLAMARRGIVLAVVSKNDERVALAAIDGHPEMILRRDDLAGWRINWDDKAANIALLCQDLELSPADAVFIDDNPGERRDAAAALPELTVPDWPSNPMLFVDAIRRLNVFDVAAVTDEDLLRARSYAAQRARRAAPPNAAGEPDVRIDIRPLTEADLIRTLQLLNKTNQMSLTTRRLGRSELDAMASSPERGVWTVRVADRFAEYGLTGAFALEFDGSRCAVTDFVMSCRVMARGVEQKMLDRAAAEAAERGCSRLTLGFVPTDRNEPMRRFLVEADGLVGEDGLAFRRDLGPARAAGVAPTGTRSRVSE
jgi:FkbH-like protein